MNERINQLAREAGLIAPYGSDRQGLRDFDYRMFAELIVRECAEQVDWILAEGGKTQGDMLKEHFGVEDRAIPILSADEEALLSGITSSKLFTIEAAKKAFLLCKALAELKNERTP